MASSYSWPVVPLPAPLPGGPPTLLATSGVPRKVEEIKANFPPIYSMDRGGLLAALLHSIGWEDHRVIIGDRALIVRQPLATGTVRYVAKIDDPALEVKHVIPNSLPSTLSVTMSGRKISVNLEIDSLGVIQTTPKDIADAIAAIPSIDDLVYVQFLGSGSTPVRFTREFEPLVYEGLKGAEGDIQLNHARGEDLRILGQNYGVTKPSLLPLLTDQFRMYIAALAFKRKLNVNIIERLLFIFYGPKETGGWDTYEIDRHTITIELPSSTLRRKPGTGTYLRLKTAASTSNHTGDYFRANASQSPHGPVKPTTLDPVSSIQNNSIYISPSGGGYEKLRSPFDLVRAAGVKIVFKTPSE